MFSPFGLKSPLGRTYNTDLDDIRRAKKAFRHIGYFETPSYGLTDYPDEPLFKAIETFQSDNGLRRDGVMKPRGQTATTLGKRLTDAMTLKAETPKELEKPKTNNTQTAFAPVIPVIVYEVAVYMGMTVSAAWVWWQTKTATEKKAIITQMKGSEGSSGEEGLDQCDHLHYNVDMPRCRAISKRKGKSAGQRCIASANARYAACLVGVPMDRLPPLDTWDN